VSEPAAIQANKGFYRGDAYLLLIFLSDANDGTTNLTASYFHERLVEMKGRDRKKVMAYAANWTPDCGAQNQDPGHEAPTKFKEFIDLTGGSVFSLCSPDYGSHLAKIGVETTKKISRRVIPLNGVPDLGTLEVKYGSQVIPSDYERGWSYEPDRVALILSGELDLKPEPGAQLTIRFVPVVLANVQNGQTKTLGQ
jgi:hypothetical protein